MRVVFMGTPQFAVPSLEAVAARHQVVAVYTRPDAVRGRGSRMEPSAVKRCALELGLTVREPRTLRDPEVLAQMAADDADIIVVAAYGLILPSEVLEAARLGAVNVHASLLPRWRGAAPVQRAILAGDETTGVSIMRMEEGLDTGPFCEVETVAVDGLDASQLTEALAAAGAAALLRALSSIEAGTCTWVEQDETATTYADKLTRADVALDPLLDAATLVRRVRAAGPSAPARLRIGDTGITAVVADVHASGPMQGVAAVAPEGVLLGTADGAVLLERIKPDGKREMAATDWARGARVTATTWSAESR